MKLTITKAIVLSLMVFYGSIKHQVHATKIGDDVDCAEKALYYYKLHEQAERDKNDDFLHFYRIARDAYRRCWSTKIVNRKDLHESMKTSAFHAEEAIKEQRKLVNSGLAITHLLVAAVISELILQKYNERKSLVPILEEAVHYAQLSLEAAKQGKLRLLKFAFQVADVLHDKAMSKVNAEQHIKEMNQDALSYAKKAVVVEQNGNSLLAEQLSSAGAVLERIASLSARNLKRKNAEEIKQLELILDLSKLAIKEAEEGNTILAKEYGRLVDTKRNIVRVTRETRKEDPRILASYREALELIKQAIDTYKEGNVLQYTFHSWAGESALAGAFFLSYAKNERIFSYYVRGKNYALLAAEAHLQGKLQNVATYVQLYAILLNIIELSAQDTAAIQQKEDKISKLLLTIVE